MIEMEDIPITKEEYIAMVKTINQLRKEKQHLIDKAHVWLMENYDKYVRVIGSSIYFAYFELGKDFRKAMEGQQ